MIKKMSYSFCFDFSRAVSKTAKNGIFKNQNNMSSRAVFFLQISQLASIKASVFFPGSTEY